MVFLLFADFVVGWLESTISEPDRIPPSTLHFPSYISIFAANKDHYCERLPAISEHGEWLEWLRFFFHGVAEQAHDAVQRARALQDLQKEWYERLSDQRSVNAIRLADALLANPILSTLEAQRFLGVTHHTAQNNIYRLVEVGILAQHTESRYGKLFASDEILEILT